MPARLTVALVAALALLAALPAGAAAQRSRDAQRVYDDYRSDAEIAPCDHTAAVYRRTLRELTPEVEEETPAFRPAVEAALRERRRRGEDCARAERPAQDEPDEGVAGGGTAGGSAGSAAPPAQAPAPPPPPPAPPAQSAPPAPETQPTPAPTPAPTVAPAPPVTSSAPPPAAEPVLLDRPHEGTPTGILIALALLGLTALLALLAFAAHRLGWGGERLAGARHAWGEAAYRAGGTWADFVDWLRLGRGPHRL